MKGRGWSKRGCGLPANRPASDQVVGPRQWGHGSEGPSRALQESGGFEGIH